MSMGNQNDFSVELLEQLAKTARIALTEEEKQRYFQQLQAMIHFASVLPAEVPETAGAEADAVCGLDDLRRDVAVSCLSRDVILEMAAEKANGCFTVPRAVEG